MIWICGSTLMESLIDHYFIMTMRKCLLRRQIHYLSHVEYKTLHINRKFSLKHPENSNSNRRMTIYLRKGSTKKDEFYALFVRQTGGFIGSILEFIIEFTAIINPAGIPGIRLIGVKLVLLRARFDCRLNWWALITNGSNVGIDLQRLFNFGAEGVICKSYRPDVGWNVCRVQMMVLNGKWNNGHAMWDVGISIRMWVLLLLVLYWFFWWKKDFLI